MSKEEVLAKLAAGQLSVEEATKKLEEIEAQGRQSLYCKVSQKQAVSVYGLQRMPVTLYAGQWERLLNYADEIQKFIKEHDADLSRKDK